MGVDFNCDGKNISMSYSAWNNIRRTIIIASINYIKEKILNAIEEKNNRGKKGTNDFRDDENDIYLKDDYHPDNNTYSNVMNNLLFKLELLFKKDDGNESDIKSIFNQSTRQIRDLVYEFNIIIMNTKFAIDSFIYFDVNGLFSLCNKNDCEGYYSSGNSLDIINLLDLIKHHIQNTDKEVYNMIYMVETGGDNYFSEENGYFANIYNLFKTSWEKNKKISID